MGALATNGQTLAVTEATVAANLHQTLDVLRNLAVQVTFDGEVLVDVFADLLQIVFGDILDTNVRVNAGLCNDLLGGRVADAVNVGQTDLDALLAREVDAEKTSHGISSSLFLALALLVTRVLANDEDLAMTPNDLALVAHLLDRRTDLHACLL